MITTDHIFAKMHIVRVSLTKPGIKIRYGPYESGKHYDGNFLRVHKSIIYTSLAAGCIICTTYKLYDINYTLRKQFGGKLPRLGLHLGFEHSYFK